MAIGELGPLLDISDTLYMNREGQQDVNQEYISEYDFIYVFKLKIAFHQHINKKAH